MAAAGSVPSGAVPCGNTTLQPFAEDQRRSVAPDRVRTGQHGRPPSIDSLQPFDDELGTAVVAPIAVLATLYTFAQLGRPIDCLLQAPATAIAANRRVKLTPLMSLDQLRRGPGPRWGVHLM